MKIQEPLFLAVDTSGPKLGCIIAKEDSLITQEIFEGERDHCKNIITIIDQALVQANVKIQDIDAFGCIHGPGSFTGLRIGMMAVKTLSHIHQKPLIGIHTFERMVHLDHHSQAQYLWPAQKNHAYRTVNPLGGASQIQFGRTIDMIDLSISQTYYPEDMHDQALTQGVSLPFAQICGTNLAQRLWHHWKDENFLETMHCHPLYVQEVAAKPNVKVS